MKSSYARYFGFLLLLLQGTLFAQGLPAATPLTLSDAVTQALARYPAVRAALERQAAAAGRVGLAQTAYLPRADMLWQANRATHNNIFGLLLPQSVVPAISGPVLNSTTNQAAWGSAAGVLFSWEPLDFGQRHATVNTARAGEGAASADSQFTRLNVALLAANTYLSLLAAQQSVQAARADVDRRQAFANSVHVLVDNQLRPGADASRADAELAAARIVLIQIETAERTGRIALAELTGLSPENLSLNSGALLQLPPEAAFPAASITGHPLAKSEGFRVQAAIAQRELVDRSYVPRFNLQSSYSGRGSGNNNDGTFAGGSGGLGLDRQNWAVGLTATFPAFDYFSLRQRRKIAVAEQRAESARYDQTLQDLTAGEQEAQAVAVGQRQIALATPVELKAAQDGEQQARARYQAGLATVVEVTEAQSLLVRAQIDDALAKINAWRSLASLAAAAGDLQPFVDLLNTPGGR